MEIKKDKKHEKQSGDAKGKASFDQNGEGSSPKYGHAGHEPNESNKINKHTDAQKKP